MRMSAKGLVRACTPRALRNWLRSPARSAEWCWNEARHTAGMEQVIEVRAGWRLRSHPSAYRFAYFAQDADPDQVSEFDSFIASCRADMVLFDIGAHFASSAWPRCTTAGTRPGPSPSTRRPRRRAC
jgi:hypothetical protein